MTSLNQAHIDRLNAGGRTRTTPPPAAPIFCGYCDQEATCETRDGAEPLCKGCARSQTDGPVREYVKPLTLAGRRRYATGS